MNSDASIIAEVRAGNRAAFAQLVERHQDRLYGTLLHLTGQEADAREVAQDAFVQAFTKLDRFEGRSAFYTWLYRIAFNLWASRRRRRRPTISIQQQQESFGFDLRDSIDTPLEQLASEERVRLVKAALAALPDEARAILLLREMDGCDYDTIAETLAVPVGTVRSRLHRARLLLKRHLEIDFKENA